MVSKVAIADIGSIGVDTILIASTYTKSALIYVYGVEVKHCTLDYYQQCYQ